jgi:hypothetical protein
MANSRVPGDYPKFDLYIKSTNNFLQSVDPDNPPNKQWQRLGLTLAEADDWKARELFWTTNIYLKYGDENQKTKTVVLQCMNFKKAFAEFARPLLNRMAASAAATEQDETIFRFKINRKDPERRTTPITEELFAGISRKGSTEYLVNCRAEEDSKRASLPAGVDSVIISSKVVTIQPADPATVDPEGEGFRQKSLSKARFLYKAGSGNKGKYLVIAFRWNYSKNPDLAGAWSEVQTILIS